MSTASKQKMTTNIMPEVIESKPVAPAIPPTQPGTLTTVQAEENTTTETTDDNALPALILLVPIVFLIAIVVLLIERAIKWGVRRFLTSQKTANLTATPRQAPYFS